MAVWLSPSGPARDRGASSFYATDVAFATLEQAALPGVLNDSIPSKGSPVRASNLVELNALLLDQFEEPG
jgi:hypothetical protein